MSTTTETLGAVKARQSVWTDSMQAQAEGLTDTDLVEVTTLVTPFGNFLQGFTKVGA